MIVHRDHRRVDLLSYLFSFKWPWDKWNVALPERRLNRKCKNKLDKWRWWRTHQTCNATPTLVHFANIFMTHPIIIVNSFFYSTYVDTYVSRIRILSTNTMNYGTQILSATHSRVRRNLQIKIVPINDVRFLFLPRKIERKWDWNRKSKLTHSFWARLIFFAIHMSYVIHVAKINTMLREHGRRALSSNICFVNGRVATINRFKMSINGIQLVNRVAYSSPNFHGKSSAWLKKYESHRNISD